MKKPLAYLAVFFCLGILAAAGIKVHFFIFYLIGFLFLVSSVIFLKQNTKFNITILCAAFFLGGALLKNFQILPNCHIANLMPYGSDSVSLIGVIDNDPVGQNRRASFILKIEKIKINEDWIKSGGKVLAKIFINNDFTYGDRLFLSGKLYRPFSFSKDFNYRNYLRRQGIYLILSVKKDNIIKQLDKNAGNPIKSLALRLKHKMKDVIVKNLFPFSAGILNAIILGERQNLPAYVRDVLVRSGTVHIIAISGLHLWIVAFIILLILKIMKIPRKPRYILTILLLIVYCILTGAKPPVVRATVMASILFFAFFLKRETDIYNSLSIASLIILTVNPQQLFEVSFQLSFLSVISIVWLSPKIKSLFPEELNKISWLGFLISVFSVSFAAWLGLLPMIAYYFKIFSPITILANMIIVPFMSIIVASGFSLAFVGILIPCLTLIFAAGNEMFISILFKINSLLIAIPGAYFKLPRISFVYVLVYYALLISIFGLFKIAIRRQKSPGALNKGN